MGFGAEVAAVVQHQAFDWLDAPIERVGAKFVPIPFAPVMEEFVVPHQADVLEAIMRTVGRNGELRSTSRGSARAWKPGTIVRWLKSEGDAVEKGEPLYELDTDKVTQEVEADASGRAAEDRVARRARSRGRQADRGHRRGGRGRRRRGRSSAPRMPARRRARRARARGGARARPRSVGRGRRGGRAGASTDGRVKASPLARRIARERGIDLAAPRRHRARRAGSSPRTSSAPQPAPAARHCRRRAAARSRSCRSRSIRKTIARRLTEAWQAPAFQITMSADMTRANALVASGSASSTRTCASTVTDVLTKLCAHRAPAPPRGERAVRRRRDPALPDRERRASRSRTAAGSSSRSSASAERKSLAQIAAARADLVAARARGQAPAPTTSRAAPSRSPTSACTASSSSSPCSTRRRRRSWRSARSRSSRSPRDGELVVRPMMTMTLTVRPPRRRRRDGRRVPADGQGAARRARRSRL